MLWTERYHPVRLGDIVGQDRVIEILSSFSESGTIPHLMLACTVYGEEHCDPVLR